MIMPPWLDITHRFRFVFHRQNPL